MHHPLGGIEFLVWEKFMMHDECVGCWNTPPHHPRIFPYKQHPLQPLPLTYVRPLFPDEGRGVHHTCDFWGFDPMAGSEAHSSWHGVSLIFAIFAILRSMECPTTDDQNSLVFMNENGQIPFLLPLLMNNMMQKLQRLTYMLNIRYGCSPNQLISW